MATCDGRARRQRTNEGVEEEDAFMSALSLFVRVIFSNSLHFFQQTSAKLFGGVLKLRDADKHTHTHTHARKERKIER